MYHLGKIAGEKLTEEIKKNCPVESPMGWENVKDIFLLSCLLHDVGHAPFSHTGENFFLDDTTTGNQRESLHNTLIGLVDSENFKNDVLSKKSKAAAPHEIMSAIIGIKNFGNHLRDPLGKELFARSITGYKFSNNDKLHSLYNCYISLLNSKVIDVDRLDYLIRDAYFTGFDTVSIDHERLLTNITICQPGGNSGAYELAFRKGAISVIENFVYAHDSERKWIQNHPAILYEMYIIEHIVSTLNEKLSSAENKLFSLECLSEEGQELKNGVRISLLCDDDIISLMKAHCSDDALCKEFFSRQSRRSPLWKTEEEYKKFLLRRAGLDVLKPIESALSKTKEYLRKNSEGEATNSASIKKLEEDIGEIEQNNSPDVDIESIEEQKESKKQILKVMKCLQPHCDNGDIECDFIILEASQFYSGFNKVDFPNINIVFPGNDKMKPSKFGDIVTSLKGYEKSGDNFFYIFYRRSEKQKLIKEDVCNCLIKTFL
ncbi:hypothetical protein FWH09_00575 [Candidatus Saccharibacteria bacterium]|nr:hypothetical protein [Candidatus Saccharibacteria bacterium]